MVLGLDLGSNARAFRDEVRQWLEANRPEELVGVEAERAVFGDVPGVAEWTGKLHEAGYLCVAWPEEYGGFNVIGGLNNGWRVTVTTLGNEQGGNATTQHVQYTKQFWGAVDLAREIGADRDPLVRQQLAWAYTHCEIMRFQGLRGCWRT
jgi:alkylation response protein AidB-like acyl-CoA dehydrogenase